MIAGPKTKYIFIVSTIDKDPTWIAIVKSLKKKHVITYDSIITDEGVNILEQFIKENKPKDDEESEGDEDEQNDEDEDDYEQGEAEQEVDDEFPKRQKTWKHPYPEYIIVMDDLGEEMRNKVVAQLTKTNRHHRGTVIMSAQSETDLHPKAVNNTDYVLAFSQIPEKPDLERLYKKLRVSVPYKKFDEMYKDATSKPYGFLYIGRTESKNEFRDGFTEKYNT